jgi:hypothetical protein
LLQAWHSNAWQLIDAAFLRIALNQALILFAPQAQNHPMFCGNFRPL